MAVISLKINGKSYQTDVDANTPLLWVLRDHLDLAGTKYGCGMAMCGACMVHINGEATRSCVLPVSAVENAAITTIEGLSATGNHPVQQAWNEIDVPQCGYCQSGQMMSAAALLAKNSNPSDKDIEAAMTGNICRCGTYHRIHDAVKLAATKMKK
ncbi:MAG: (2Fe-2S)-binding protein [Cytophagia bacterium]|nr:MAG: (2Fe-2S)-binding protein [Runella sp.]TAG19689.1 MAG: (2Fe-2S)-binding protein [Cytophagales bacterium]TAG38847.1 MAG: (2Fe-2S)-binding protein [Cytophagia bacterium]TAG52620.1 MAG: (2Fe-2S)-binding protein [Runella slithyformis]TAG74264.1 MAG: (2Fe-2S)-binding protein [Runella slithyformis]